MRFIKIFILAAFSIYLLPACKQKQYPKLIFKFKFDPTQARLGSTGQPDPMPSNHAGQDPSMNFMSAHYIEISPSALTPLGSGPILYQTANTTAGGGSAIDFQHEILTPDSGIFFQTALNNVVPGTYPYLRISLAYQNYGVKLYIDTTISSIPIQQEIPCTVASFIGVNTYITSYKVNTENIAVNANRAQGYWGFEATGSINGYPYNYLTSGQAPPGQTTVVNPLFATSPIPAGSCVVTAAFDGGPLTITGNETKDIVVTVSLSTNKSFEWIEVNQDGKWEPAKGEDIVNMGIRGMIPYVQY